jgi:ABC-type transport system involved in cytochrome bd biosynthesis fused ATPase/permease subunit
VSDRDEQFLQLYRDGRVGDQLAYYDARVAEYESAHSQVVTISATFAALAAFAGVLAAADVAGQRPLWAALAVAFPALATAFTAYDALYAFQHQARLFQDAAQLLDRTRAAEPDTAQAADQQARSQYVSAVENILVTESGHWGQLISDLKLPDAPGKDGATG